MKRYLVAVYLTAFYIIFLLLALWGAASAVFIITGVCDCPSHCVVREV